MASDNEASCVCDPNFAVICSFLEKFATSCGIAYPNFQELQEMLENSLEVPQPLIDLHVKLLRKSRKNVSVERWEKALIKFCHSYSNQDGWEIERFGYKKARLAVKLNLLKTLLEQQFDMNTRFKAEVNRLSADELRTQPLGRDKQGLTYWCQLDEDCNLRVYREDLDEETWDIVARDREGLVHLISQLSSDDPLHNGLDSTFNEDSNSLEIEKPITDTGQMDDDEEPEEEIEEEEGEVEEDNESLLDDVEDSDDDNLGEEIVAPKVKVSFKELRQQIGDKELRQRTGHKELSQQTDDELRQLTDDKELRQLTEDKELKQQTGDTELRQQTDDKELRQQTDDKELRQVTDDKVLMQHTDDKELMQQTGDGELRQQTDDKELTQQTGANRIPKNTADEKSFAVCETLAQKQSELAHDDKDTTAAAALDNCQVPGCLQNNVLELTHSNKLVQSVDEKLPEVENSAEFIVECTEKTPTNDSSELKSEHREDKEESQNNTLCTKENKVSSEVTEKFEELKTTQDNCEVKKMEVEHSNVTVEKVTDKNNIMSEEEDITNKKHTFNEEQLKNEEEVSVEDKLKIRFSGEIVCEKINLTVSKPLREPAVAVCENLSMEKIVENCIPVESRSNMESVDGENKKNVSTKVVIETAEVVAPVQPTQPVQGRFNSEFGLASDTGTKSVDVHALQLKSFKEELKRFDTNLEVAKEDTRAKVKEEYKNTGLKEEPEIKQKSQEELKKFNFKSDVRTEDRPKVRDEFKKLEVKPEFRLEESRIKPVNFASLQHQMRVESKLDLRTDLRSKQFGSLGSHQAGMDLSSARGMMFDKQSIRKQTPMLDLSRTRVENVGMDLSSKKSPEIPLPSNMSRKPDLKISHSVINSGVCDLSTKKSPDKVMHPPSYDPGQSQSSYHFSSNIPLGIGALPHHLATDLTTRKSFTLNDFMNVRKEAVRNLATLSQIEKLTLLSQSIRPGEERKTFLTPEEISRGLKRDLREPGISDSWLNKMGRYVEPSENRGSGSVHPSPVQVGEAIEEPLMLVRGEGSGRDCDTGNPGTDTQDSGSKVDKVDQNISEDKVLPTNSVTTSDQSVVGLPDAETRELTGSVCITELQLPAFENEVTGNESVSLKVCVANAQICENARSKAHAENNEESMNGSDLENLNLLCNENKDVDKRDASIHLSHSFHTTVQNKTVMPEEHEKGKSKFYDDKLTVQENTSTTFISDSLKCTKSEDINELESSGCGLPKLIDETCHTHAKENLVFSAQEHRVHSPRTKLFQPQLPDSEGTDILLSQETSSGHESMSDTSNLFSFTPPQSEFRQPRLVPRDEPNRITLTDSLQMSIASSVSDSSLGNSEPSCATKKIYLNASNTLKANDCQKFSSAKSPHKLWSIEAICGPDKLKNTYLHPDSTSDVSTSFDVSSSVVDRSESVPVKPEKKWSLGVQVFEKSAGASAIKRASRWDVGTPEKAKMEDGCDVVSSLNADHELHRDSLDTTVNETANGSDEVPFSGSSEFVLDIEASSCDCTTEKYLTEVREQCTENDVEENVSSSEKKEKLSPCNSAFPKEPEILSVPDKNVGVTTQCFEQEKLVEDAHSSVENVEDTEVREENSIFDKAATFMPESSKSKTDECNKSLSKFFFGPESLHTSLTDPAISSTGCVSNPLVADKSQLNVNTLLQTSKCILNDNHIHLSGIDALKNSTNLKDSGIEKFSFNIDKIVGHKLSTENLTFGSDDVQKEAVEVSSVRLVEVHRSQVEVVEREDVAENAGADKVTHADCEVDSVVNKMSSNNDLSLQSETVVTKDFECSKKCCENKQEIEVNKEIGELLKTSAYFADSDCDTTCADVDLSSSKVISLEADTDSISKHGTFDSVSHEDDNNAVLAPCTAVAEKDCLQQATLPFDMKNKLVSDTVCEGINSERKNENTESVKGNIEVQECPDFSIHVLPDSCQPKEKSILSKNSVIIPSADRPDRNKVTKKLLENIVTAEKSKVEVPNSAVSSSTISALSKFHPQACVGKRRKSVESITMGIMMGKLSGKAGLELQSKITDMPLSGTQLLDRMLDFKGRNAKPDRLICSPPEPLEESLPVASPVAQQTFPADLSSDNSKTHSVPVEITDSKEENDKFLTVESQLEAMMSDDPVPLVVGNQEVQNVSDQDACVINDQTGKQLSDMWYAAEKQSTSCIKQQESGESSENLSDVERFVSETLIKTTNCTTESHGESGEKTVEISLKTSSTQLVADSSVCGGESHNETSGCNETERLSWVADLLDDCSRTSTGSHKNSSVSDGSRLVNNGNQCNTESESCEIKSLPAVEANECSESRAECKGVCSTKPEILPKVTANIDEVIVSKNLDISVDNSSKVQCQTDEAAEKLIPAASNNKKNSFSRIDYCDKSGTQTENGSVTLPPDLGKFSRKLAEGKKPQSDSEHSSSIRLLEVLENSSSLEESDECLSREAENIAAAAEASVAAKDEKPDNVPTEPQIQVGRLKVIPEASMASFMKSSLILCKEDPVSINFNEKRNFIDLVGNSVTNSVAQGCKIPFVENKSELLTFDPHPAAIEVNIEKTVAIEVNAEKTAVLEEESVLSRVQAQLAVKLSTSSADTEKAAEKHAEKNKVVKKRERVKKGKAGGKKTGERRKTVRKVPAKNNLGEGLVEERLGNDSANDGKGSTNENSKAVDGVLEIDGKVESDISKNEGSNNKLKEKMGAKFTSLLDSNECAQKTEIYPLKKPCTLSEFSMDYNPAEQIMCSPLPPQTMARPKPVGRNRRRSSKSTDAKLGIGDKPITAQDDEKRPIVESEINDNVIPQRTTRSRNLRSGTAPLEFFSPVGRKRRSSKRLGSVSEDDEGTTGDVAKRKKAETGESTSKRRKLRGKKTPDLELRRSIEEQKRLEGSASSSEDEDHQANIQGEDASTDDSQANVSFRGRGRGGRGRSRGRGRGGSRGKGRGRVAQESKILLDSPVVSSDAPSEPPKPAAKKSKVSRLLKDLDLGAELIISNSAGPSSGMPVRQSRRIAQIKIKEEAERRRIEEMTLFVITEEQISSSDKKKKKKDKHEKNHDSQHSKSPRKRRKKHSDEDYIDEPEEQVVSKKQKRKRRKKKLNILKFNENNPWVSSSGSSSSVEEEDEDEEPEPTDDESNVLFKSDHEFSPESDLGEDCDSVPVPRRARTAQKEVDSGEAAVADDHACQKCGKTDHPEWILLCDKCDCGWHGSCLRPALLVIPEGDWFCPPCEHTVLLVNLQERLREFDRCAKRRDNEELRRKRLAYVGISLDNVLPNKDKEGKDSDGDSCRNVKEKKSSSSSDSGTSSSDESEPVYQLRERRQALFSYRFNEYDDLINSAIQDELEAVKGAGNQGRGKDIANIVNAEKSEPVQKLTNGSDETNKGKLDDNEDVDGEEEEEEEEEGYIPPVKPKYVNISKKKHRRLNSLDISSEDDADSDEDFKGTSSEEEEEEEEDEEADSDDSDAVRGSRRRSQPVRRSARARTTRFDREFINDDSEDSDYGPKRKKTRRLWVDSESEESDTWGRSKRRKSSGSHKSSHKSKSKKKKKKHYDSGADSSKDKTKKRKVKFGGLDSVDDVPDMPRTRGRKMNYQEIVGSDSEEEILKAIQRKIESDEEFVAAQEDVDEDDDEIVKAEEEEEKHQGVENGQDDQEETVESSEEFVSSKPNSKKANEEKKSKATKKKKPVKRREKKSKLRTVKTIRVKRVATPVESEEEVGGAEEEEDDDDEEELEDDGIPSMTEEEREMLEIEAQAEEEERMYLEEMEREALAAEDEQLDDEEEDEDVLEEEEEEVEEEEEEEEDAVLAAEKAQLFVIKEAEKAKRAAKEERKRLKKEQKKFEKKEQKKLGKLAKQFEEAQAASADVLPEISSGVLGNSSSVMSPEPPAVPVTMQPPLAAIPTTSSYSITCAQPHMPVREMPVGMEHKLEEGEVPITAVMSDAIAPVKPKRRGRGRGKATIAAAAAAEAAAAAASAANEMGIAGGVPDGLQRFSVPQGYQPQLQTQTQPSPHSQIPSHSQSATPPQSTGSVITRMLQSQPVSAQSFTAAATAMGHKYFGGPPLVGEQGSGTGRGNGPHNQAQQYSMPRGRIPSPYRQPPPPLTNSPNGSPHYGRPPMNQLSQMRIRSQIPAGQPPQMYHTSHHPLDPSPSGGGPIAIAPNTSTGGSSPLHQPPAPSSSPLSNKAGHNTPPPPPYTRPTMTVPQSPGPSIPPPLIRYPLQGPEIISPATNGVRQQANQYAPPSTAPSHLHQSQQQTSRATIPPTPYPSYHPAPPPSYHYGAYPPPPPLAAADDALPPTAYQGSPYPDQYASSDQIQPSDGSNSKSYDDEGGGEFGGLVSYFSSQREDDLDT